MIIRVSGYEEYVVEIAPGQAYQLSDIEISSHPAGFCSDGWLTKAAYYLALRT
jgi:hypothetical protein